MPGWQKYLLGLLGTPLIITMIWMMFFSEKPADLLPIAQVLATVVGFTLAAVMIAWQQRASKKAELKFKLFESLNGKIEAVCDACGEAGTYALLIPRDLETYRNARVAGQSLSIKIRSAPEFNVRDGAVGRAVADLVIATENHAIIFQEAVEIFQLAFHSSAHDKQEAFWPFFRDIMQKLPMPHPDGAGPVLDRPPVTDDQLAVTEQLAKNYYDSVHTISTYARDLSVVCQNMLLGEIFVDSPGAAVRVPLDPTFKVIDVAPEAMAELKRYFRNETPWGRRIQESEREVLAAIAKRETVARAETKR